MAPRRCAGISLITVVITSGIITAVPEAWTTRPTSSVGKPGASAQTSVPAPNSVIEARNTWRDVNRCSRNPLVSHCTVVAVTSRATISCGNHQTRPGGGAGSRRERW